MSVISNIFVGHLATAKRFGFIASKRQSESVARTFIKRFKIRGTRPRPKVIEPSGGNQQKVALTRSLTNEKDVVNFDEPIGEWMLVL